jgi:hypothetical protein
MRAQDLLDDLNRHRVKHLSTSRTSAIEATKPSILQSSHVHAWKSDQELTYSPLQWMTNTASLTQPFSKIHWQIHTSYTLGVNVPGEVQPRRADGTCVCRRSCGSGQPDALGHHAMNCGTTNCQGGHDYIDDQLIALVKQAGVRGTNNKNWIPKHNDIDNSQGDGLVYLSCADHRNLYQVYDVTLVHPVTVSMGPGSAPHPRFKHSKVGQAHTLKMNAHRDLYALRSVDFFPCVASTYGALEADFLRFLYILASRRAHYIKASFRPDADLQHLLATYFAINKAKIGVAVAKGMVYRSLSLNRDGLKPVNLPKGRHVEQELAMDGMPHVGIFAHGAF